MSAVIHKFQSYHYNTMDENVVLLNIFDKSMNPHLRSTKSNSQRLVYI